MKQLLQALPSDVSLASTPGVSSSAYACASELPVHSAGFGLATAGTSGRTRTLHGASRLMVIPTNAHRRPRETPT